MAALPHIRPTVQVEVRSESENFLLLSYGTGLSDEGLFVRASRSLPLGSEAELMIFPSRGGEGVLARGRVVVVHGGPGIKGMEISFILPEGGVPTELKLLVEQFKGGAWLTR